jgi:hypothetical protein
MTEPNQTDEMAPGGPTPDADEFAGIAPAPPPRSPVLALVIIGLSAVTIFHLRAEIRYALGPRSAAPIETLRGAGESVVDRYVTVRGVPDRRNSLDIEARGQTSRESFFRLLDADPPIFVRAIDTKGRTDLGASWTGRLRRFKDVPYASSLRDYLDKGAEIARNLELASFRTAVASGDANAAVRDRMGRTVTLPADHNIEIETKATEYALSLDRDKFPKQEDAQHELERIVTPFGIAVHPLPPTPESFRFGTPMLEQYLPRRNTLFAALDKAEVDLAPYVPVYKVPRSGIRLDGETLVLKSASGETKLAWADVRGVAFQEPLRVDDDGLVLTEGESPAGFLWAPIVALVLLVLVAFNVWYLLRARRGA